MNINRTFMIKLLTVSAMLMISFSAGADRDGRRGDLGDKRHENFRKHSDIRHFDRHDYDVWRSGSWRRVRHDGKFGWWWVAAGTWYFYHQPVYPFPDPYTPPVVVIQPPPADMLSTIPPPAQYWYFCSSANSYYPYVPSCPEDWKRVPANPPQNAPATKPAQ
ncbi:MAG TPA: hypothetical protein VMV48_04545 [Gallionellaceae bacterium]|nr:hypothetical protein [Gallionellaceae bacterium]